MIRLGRNAGGYAGEPLPVASLLREVEESADRHGWRTERLCRRGDYAITALERPASPERHRLYLSTGIHGDEPAGPLAVAKLLRENRWPAECSISLCPCLNPQGFALNRRENADGVDLNRDYRHRETEEIRAHIEWLSRQRRFDLSLCLHEDWESHGFYLYELNPHGGPSAAEAMVEAVSRVCPLDLSPVIEGRPAVGGIIRPELDPAQRPRWPEAFYLIQNCTRISYTLEAPSDFTLGIRVEALVTAVRAALTFYGLA